MSKQILRDYPSTEATRDPIYLLETCNREGGVDGEWVVDHGHGVWFTRQEAESYGTMRDYHYGVKDRDWRVYCCCSEGQLAEILKQHTVNQDGGQAVWSPLQKSILDAYEGGELSHTTPENLDQCGDGLLRFLMVECSPKEDCSTWEIMNQRIETAVGQLHALIRDLEQREEQHEVFVISHTHDQWLRKITDLIIERLEIPNGDAQGIVEAHDFEISQEWARGSEPTTVAARLIAL